jgi:F-type H+-transporting ATPase subunit epsilon
MPSKLAISIITPEGTLAKTKDVDVLVAKTTTGEVAILPDHIPLFTRLEHGELRLNVQGKNFFYTIFQGFLHLDPDNNVTILADNAQRSEELNLDAIKKAKLAAEKALEEKEKLSATEILRAETAIRRAIMELRVAQKRIQSSH